MIDVVCYIDYRLVVLGHCVGISALVLLDSGLWLNRLRVISFFVVEWNGAYEYECVRLSYMSNSVAIPIVTYFRKPLILIFRISYAI